jgi:Carbohydrate esterase, sialic acid-specific acetylesterase
MITQLQNKNFIKKVKQGVYHKIILIFLVLPFSVFGQSIIWQEKPISLQVYARDSLNKGYVVFKGDVDKTGGNIDYTLISIEAKRNGSPYGGTFTQTLIYTGELAPFNFSIAIDAEKINYSFKVILQIGTTSKTEYSVVKIVAGDVFIIQGQSNAEARNRKSDPNNPPSYLDSTNTADSFNMDEFIRVYAGGTFVQAALEAFHGWFVAKGDIGIGERGNAGQWGLKLAKLIINDTINNTPVPIAIFNGARPGAWIDYFQENFTGDSEPTNNYERLLYRLDTTRLKSAVKAIFWSQGENVQGVNSVSDYKNSFLALRSSWLTDYPNIKKFYIFQTINGCNSDLTKLQYTKEAQRQLAEENTDIYLMTTDGLVQYYDDVDDYCHFLYSNGYEGFANRLFELVKRDFYGGADYADIEPPNILNAYLTDDVKLVVETDANNLNLNDVSASNHFFGLDNAGSATITDIQVSGSKIVFTLSEFPGNTATISNLGAIPGLQNFLITNSNFLDNLELVSFDKFPIDASRFTMWDSTAWSNNPPDSTKYALIKGVYNASNGNIEAKDLTINSGFNLNFDSGTTNSVIVHGDLTIDGIFTIGDQESLVMTNDSATITGNIIKIENSTVRNSAYDFTYWSSPITNADIGTVFAGVTPSRIFYFDQPQSSATDPANDPNYWNIWQPASGSMTPGLGYAAEGLTGTTGVHNISFTGPPNNGIISYTLKGFFGDSEPDNDFNLIGNPYPSAINILDFFNANSNIESTIWLWTHTTEISAVTTGDFVSSDYATFNLTGGVGVNSGPAPTSNIGSSQGFFVRAMNPGAIEFNNSMRLVGANNQFYKTNRPKKKLNEMDRIWLDLTSDQSGFNQILVGFTDKATDGIDSGYDASRLDGGNPINFYSQIDTKKYVIQGLNTFSIDKSVTLGFDINVAPRILTIAIDKTEGALKDVEVYLVDHVLNVTHDLKKSDYQFEQNVTGENLNRFTLQFAAAAVLDVEDIVSKNEFVVNNENESLKIRASQKVSTIQVYDMLGRILINEKPGKKSFILNANTIKNGTVLVIKAKLENGSELSKKTIKY